MTEFVGSQARLADTVFRDREKAQEKATRLPRAKEFLRRATASATIPLAVVTFLKAADTLTTDAVFPPKPAAIEQIQTDTPASMIHNATFVFPPLGATSALEIAQSLKKPFEKKGLIFSVTLPSDHLGLDEVAQKMNAVIKKNDITTVSEVGDSTGGNEEDAVLPELNLDLNGGVSIDTLYYIGTPITWTDVKDGRKWLPNLIYTIDPVPGIFETAITNIIGNTIATSTDVHSREICSDNWGVEPIQRFGYAVKQTVSGASPDLEKEEVELDIHGSIAQTALWLASVNPRRLEYISSTLDGTVNDKKASNELMQANLIAASIRAPFHSGHYGAQDEHATPMTFVTIFNAEHASIGQHERAYNNAVANPREARQHVRYLRTSRNKHSRNGSEARFDRYLISSLETWSSVTTAKPLVRFGNTPNCKF